MVDIDYSYSKSFQTVYTIKKMYEHAFNLSNCDISITPLEGGMKCAVYLIEDSNKKVVLKVASSDSHRFLTYEKNTMWWEVKMLEMLQSTDIPVPKLLYYDDTCTICSSPYFFMTYIKGEKLSDFKGKLSEEKRSNIEYELGKICLELSKISGDKFFIPGFSNMSFADNYEFIKKLFNSIISDAKSKNIIIPNYDYSEFINLVDNNREALNNVSDICLVHSDMWDGNIIIDDEKVSGIVDLADMYFCDELFNFYFHNLDSETSPHFLEGFGNKILSHDEKIRIVIYRIFVILKMIIEKEYKHFSTDNSKFNWLYEKLDREMLKLKEFAISDRNYIFGTGKFAKAAAEMLDRCGVRIDGFLNVYDAKKDLPYRVYKDIPVSYVDDFDLSTNQKANIIIAKKPMFVGSGIDFFRKNGFKNVYILNEEVFFDEVSDMQSLKKYIDTVDLTKPFLNYLEINLVDNCNLNCKGCAHFSNVCSKKYVDLEQFETDLRKVTDKFNLYNFRLLGGEPLLHPNLKNILEISRKYLPNSRLIIVTNGLLLDKLSEDILKSLHDNNVIVTISLYKSTYVKLESILEKLNKFGIKYLINDDMFERNDVIQKFHTRLSEDKNVGDFSANKSCSGRFCRFIRDGKISKCWLPLLIDIVNDKFNRNFEVTSDDYILLDDIDDGWEAIDKLNGDIPFCQYCRDELYEFDWESGYVNDEFSSYILQTEQKLKTK